MHVKLSKELATANVLFIFMIEKLYDVDNLYQAYLSVKKQSGWKKSTQQFEMNFLPKLIDLSRRLQNGTYKPTPPKIFPYRERGKMRLIESYNVEDRIVQSCFVNSVLLPLIRPHLIYDNAASLEDRGTDFFRKRLEQRLRAFGREHGNLGYILKCDFSKYFDNLRHDKFYETLYKFGADDATIDFAKLLLSGHRAHLQEEGQLYDALAYYNNPIGDILEEKGMGIGSAIAQIGGILGAHKIDTRITTVEGYSDYGRYMDDFYIIAETKEELTYLLSIIKEICEEDGLFLNLKKTQIIPLKHKFTILKTQYKLTDEGILIRITDKDTFVRQYRKLRYFQSAGIEKADADRSQLSWCGAIEARFGEVPPLVKIKTYYGGLLWTNKEKLCKQS